MFYPKKSSSFSSDNFHNQADLIRDEMVFGICEYLMGIMGIIVFDHCFFNKDSDTFHTGWGEFSVAFDKAWKGFEKVVVFVDSAVLNKLFVFFYDFAYKRFHWL